MRFVSKTKNYDNTETLTTNFKMKEFASPDGFILWNTTTEQALNMFQEFRTWYNRPINPSSMFRTAEHNKKIGGASNSAHLYGIAIDIPYPTEYFKYDKTRQIQFQNNVESKWRAICGKYLKYGGSIEICDRHFHLDARMWADKKFHKYYGVSK